jgi:hypothetical protein
MREIPIATSLRVNADKIIDIATKLEQGLITHTEAIAEISKTVKYLENCCWHLGQHPELTK